MPENNTTELVRIFHLTTGGTPIIAKSRFYGAWALDDPLYLLYYRDETGEERIQVNNVTAFAATNTIEIKDENVLFCYLPNPNILSHYNDTLLKRLEPLTDDED
mgnify:CR=1 FL=1